MARRVYFAFHYDRDIWRANVVRNSDIVKRAVEGVARVADASLWEEAKKKGDGAIARMIDEGLRGTTVTAVLIGAQTAYRRWVRYEIEQSINRGNGLLGITINLIPDQGRDVDIAGPNPFPSIPGVRAGVRTYDWRTHNGYVNFPSWVEEAARAAGH